MSCRDGVYDDNSNYYKEEKGSDSRCFVGTLLLKGVNWSSRDKRIARCHKMVCHDDTLDIIING